MIISIIAAMAENRVIGRDNRLPWHIPADLARFRALTMGHPVIMGRKTFESIGHPLPGRETIVITRQPDYRAEGCTIAHDLPAAIDLAAWADEVFICGGEQIYRQALPLTDLVFLTVIHQVIAGNTFFPELPPEFVEIARETFTGAMPYSFIIFNKDPDSRR
jgi:dihydrofolate reductase